MLISIMFNIEPSDATMMAFQLKHLRPSIIEATDVIVWLESLGYVQDHLKMEYLKNRQRS